jgi:hypothetical protein
MQADSAAVSVRESTVISAQYRRRPASRLQRRFSRSLRSAMTTKLACRARCKSVVPDETRLADPVRCGAGFRADQRRHLCQNESGEISTTRHAAFNATEHRPPIAIL